MSVLRSRYFLAAIAGLLLAGSFPGIGLPGLAWIAPALILAAALKKQGWERFRIGYVAGFFHYLGSLYWLLNIPYHWHDIPLGPAAGWISLSAYLAIYPAIWVSLLSGPRDKSGKRLGGVPVQSWAGRTAWALYGAVLWVALEMVIARMFSGFPWNLLGSTQFQMTPLIQISSVTGIYGVSFLIVWVSLSLLSAALMIIFRPTVRAAWMQEIILPLAVVMILFSVGMRRMRETSPPQRTLKVTLVQPSIPQTLIWDDTQNGKRFQELIDLSTQALTNHTDLLIWPEAAVPGIVRIDTNILSAITNLAIQHHVWFIIGADDIGRPQHPIEPDEIEYYNASFLIAPDGEFLRRYRKRNLVVFGEYIPLVKWLPFVKWFTPIGGGFTPGEKAVPFAMDNPAVKTSVLICFEDIFPQLVREYVDDDTDFLVNLTNNGWFGEGAAQWQHAAGAIFRTVENGVPLVRCSNNGLTCWVDSRGTIRQIFHDARGTIYGPGFMTAEIPLLNPGETRAATYYRTNGDVFGWSCVTLSVLAIAARFARRPKSVEVPQNSQVS
jgi:apolipoprotein N-acyltransferase